MALWMVAGRVRGVGRRRCKAAFTAAERDSMNRSKSKAGGWVFGRMGIRASFRESRSGKQVDCGCFDAGYD